ncbi:MAG: hypothetical protein ACLQVL_13230 [Terriglobia bacterium]
MKKPIMATEDCIDRLHAFVDDLARNGASAEDIASALLNAFVTTAKKGRRPLDALETGAEVLSNAAERALQQAKKERSEKGRKD